MLIFGENHINEEDSEFRSEIESKAKKGDLILIKEGEPFEKEIDKNIIGIEDPFYYMFSLFVISYVKGLCLPINKNELDIIIKNQTKDGELALTAEQKYCANCYIKTVVTMFSSKYCTDVNRNILHLVFNALDKEGLNMLKNLIFQIAELASELACGNGKYSMNYNDFDHVISLKRSQDFLKNKLCWDRIFRCFIKEFSQYSIDKLNCKAIDENYIKDLLKENPSDDEKREIINDKSEIITVHLRNRVFAENLINIARKNKEKTVYFIVGNKHLKGLEEIIKTEHQCADFMFYDRVEKFKSHQLNPVAFFNDTAESTSTSQSKEKALYP